MLQVILKRVAIAIPVILVVASLTFFLVRMAPGGPFDAEKVVPPQVMKNLNAVYNFCLLYTSPSPRDGLLSRMPSSA